MLARANLMGAVRAIIQQNGWTQTHAAKILKINQPRVAEIMGMKTQHYSVDLLLKLLNRLGTRITFEIADDASKRVLLSKQLGADFAAIVSNEKALAAYEAIVGDFDNTVADGFESMR